MARVTSASLIRRAQDGDELAFDELYCAVHPGLLRYLRVLVGSDAEDVASEAWLCMVRDLHTFSGDDQAFRGWAASIARHRAIDHLRHRDRRPAVPVPADDFMELPASEDAEALALTAVATDAAVRLIATLPPDQAEAVMLRAVLGLDAKTAGKVLGKRPGAVRTAAHRGLQRLAEQLTSAPTSENRARVTFLTAPTVKEAR
ncbi:MAG: RNA polymerase sigma factor [Hamadaea sp.]|nr:RNA polymerase sigma factor [Hamadaea sp.]NUT23202.1 RNA polymerase sigma factor [Hamadaea sp.]